MRVAPLERLRAAFGGGQSLARLVRDLRALGLDPGDDVLVHASLSRIGYVPGGARTVVRALLAAVEPGGTVLFPAHTGGPRVGPDNPPAFDVRNSPTVRIGIIPETARRQPGALRSLHPTHSVSALGPRAAFFVEGHERCATPCGAGSPYDKLRAHGGKILLLGCGHAANTTLHLVEELAEVPYHMLPGEGIARMVDADGRELELPFRFHSWKARRNFMRPDPELTRLGIQRVGCVGLAESRLLDAGALCDFVFSRLRDDPDYLRA